MARINLSLSIFEVSGILSIWIYENGFLSSNSLI